MSADAVGLVLGTDEATPLEFWVAVAPGRHLQLDDVVAADRILPTGEKVSIYGIVGQVRARHEGARFDSDVFLIADGILPAEVAEAAQVQVTRVVPETFEASSERRYAAAPPQSSDSIGRCSGARSSNIDCIVVNPAIERAASVRIGPAEIAFTRMFLKPRSHAR